MNLHIISVIKLCNLVALIWEMRNKSRTKKEFKALLGLIEWKLFHSQFHAILVCGWYQWNNASYWKKCRNYPDSLLSLQFLLLESQFCILFLISLLKPEGGFQCWEQQSHHRYCPPALIMQQNVSSIVLDCSVCREHCPFVVQSISVSHKNRLRLILVVKHTSDN